MELCVHDVAAEARGLGRFGDVGEIDKVESVHLVALPVHAGAGRAAGES